MGRDQSDDKLRVHDHERLFTPEIAASKDKIIKAVRELQRGGLLDDEALDGITSLVCPAPGSERVQGKTLVSLLLSELQLLLDEYTAIDPDEESARERGLEQLRVGLSEFERKVADLSERFARYSASAPPKETHLRGFVQFPMQRIEESLARIEGEAWELGNILSDYSSVANEPANECLHRRLKGLQLERFADILRAVGRDERSGVRKAISSAVRLWKDLSPFLVALFGILLWLFLLVTWMTRTGCVGG